MGDSDDDDGDGGPDEDETEDIDVRFLYLRWVILLMLSESAQPGIAKTRNPIPLSRTWLAAQTGV